MNNYAKHIRLGAALLLVMGLSSCLKNSVVPPSDPLGGTTNIVAFVASGDVTSTTALYPQYAKDLLFAGDTVGFNVNVGYLGSGAAPQDITVNLTVDAASLTAFNANQGSNYTLPAAAVYNMPASLTIAKGKTEATGRIVINKSAYDFTQSYGLPVKISTVSSGTISSNFGTAIFSFTARNQYDGLYSVTTANMSDVVLPSLVAPPTPYNIELRTTSANSVVMYDPVYAKTYGHFILNGTSSSYYGGFSPVFTIGSTGAITSIVNYYGQPSSNGRAAAMTPSADNKYDAATKTFTVNYQMWQSGSLRTTFSEVYKYVGPR